MSWKISFIFKNFAIIYWEYFKIIILHSKPQIYISQRRHRSVLVTRFEACSIFSGVLIHWTFAKRMDEFYHFLFVRYCIGYSHLHYSRYCWCCLDTCDHKICWNENFGSDLSSNLPHLQPCKLLSW